MSHMNLRMLRNFLHVLAVLHGSHRHQVVPAVVHPVVALPEVVPQRRSSKETKESWRPRDAVRVDIGAVPSVGATGGINRS